MVVPVTLENENNFISTFAFLESGSTCSYLLSNVANSLQCKITGPGVKLDIGGFNDSKSQEANMVSVKTHPFGNIAESFTINHTFVLPSFNLVDIYTPFLNAICQQFPHLQGVVTIPQLLSNQIGLILGQDNFDLITARSVFKGPPKAPGVVLTNIGWTKTAPMKAVIINQFSMPQPSTVSRPPTVITTMTIYTIFSRLSGEWKTSGLILRSPCQRKKNTLLKHLETPFASLTTDTK